MIKNSIHFSIFVLIAILCSSCSEDDLSHLPPHIRNIDNLTVYSTDSKPVTQIRFERGRSFRDTEEALIREITHVAVDAADRVYIADGMELNLTVYEQNGNFLTRLGRQGEGPGEFLNISSIEIRQGQLVVFDYDHQKLVVFPIDSLTHSHTLPLASNRRTIDELRGAYLREPHARTDHTFLMQFSLPNSTKGKKGWDKIERRALYYFLDENGDVSSGKLLDRTLGFEVLVPMGGMTIGRPIKSFGHLLSSLADDDRIYVAWSQDFLIEQYSRDGNYEGAFYYPLKRAPAHPEDDFPGYPPEFIRKATKEINYPDQAPVLDELFFDDENRLWVSTITENTEVYKWWILQENGELITKFEWPRNKSIQTVRNGYLYTLESNEQTRLKEVVRYRMVFENEGD